MRLGSTLTLFRPGGGLLGAPPSPLKKLNNFKKLFILLPLNYATFPKKFWEHFKVALACRSTLTLPQKPNYDSYVFTKFSFSY